MATDMLLSSKGTTVPLRLMTRNCPGAVAAKRVALPVPCVVVGAADATGVLVSVPVCMVYAPSCVAAN